MESEELNLITRFLFDSGYPRAMGLKTRDISILIVCEDSMRKNKDGIFTLNLDIFGIHYIADISRTTVPTVRRQFKKYTA